MHLTRRNFSFLVSSLAASYAISNPTFAATKAKDAFSEKLIEIEKRLGARLGVAVLDTNNGRRWSHNAKERFPMCSTFKLLAVSAVLAKVDTGKENLTRRIKFDVNELVTFSPITETRISGEGMTLAEICEAAITRSDNTAANIILKSLGGPTAVTEFARKLKDAHTRLDRFETELNEATPGDPRDTTTPSAMLANLHELLLGKALSEKSRTQLKAWLIANKTGDAKVRAGVPKEWIVGDKTGAGGYGSDNDVAIIWPTDRKPILISIYITETKASFDDCNAAIAEIARTLATTIS